jgi:hypothetical protein
MPQLWTETFVSQYFWLILILFIFNYFFVNHVVPSIAKNIKARKKGGIIDKIELNKKSKNIIITLPDIILQDVNSVIIFDRKNIVNNK